MGRDSLGTRACERGETTTVEGKTQTTSGEHFLRLVVGEARNRKWNHLSKLNHVHHVFRLFASSSAFSVHSFAAGRRKLLDATKFQDIPVNHNYIVMSSRRMGHRQPFVLPSILVSRRHCFENKMHILSHKCHNPSVSTCSSARLCP